MLKFIINSWFRSLLIFIPPFRGYDGLKKANSEIFPDSPYFGAHSYDLHLLRDSVDPEVMGKSVQIRNPLEPHVVRRKILEYHSRWVKSLLYNYQSNIYSAQQEIAAYRYPYQNRADVLTRTAPDDFALNSADRRVHTYFRKIKWFSQIFT